MNHSFSVWLSSSYCFNKCCLSAPSYCGYNISGIEALLQTAQLRWCGHVIRMDNTRIPKQVFYEQLHHGFRRPGGQYKRYKDCLKTTMTQCGITPFELETLAMDRTGWHSTCKSAARV